MAFLTLTQPPTPRQLALFHVWLTAEDRLLLREDARVMIWQPNPTAARGYVRESDAQALGGERHPDWTLINDADWVEMTQQHHPVVTW